MYRLALLIVCCLAACNGPSRLSAVPQTLTDQTTVLGIANARFWADTDGPAMVQEALRARSRESDPQSAANFLALSGGSDNGAFGAGVLVGWTEKGDRPSFKLVTGISTGSLIAPFAFLGSAYDPQLRAVYTEISPEDVYEPRGLVSAVFHDALTSTDPLFHLIS